MAIEGIEQPEMIQVNDHIRLKKFDGKYDFSWKWYQDEELVYLVDGGYAPYDQTRLKRMYEYLDEHGELYFIEILEQEEYIPIGDVTFWQYDMPIVIGDKHYRGKGIGKSVIAALIQRGRALGYEALYVDEIYGYNLASRKCFESLGFQAYEQTEKGYRYVKK